METTPTGIIERFNRWLSESIMVKLASIGFLILILLIPSAWVESIIREREGRADSVVEEIASKWSGEQTVNGPLLIIPYIYRYEAEVEHQREVNGKTIIEMKKEMKERIERAYFLPEKLNINGSVEPEVRHRGIFEAAVYKSNIDLKATFNTPWDASSATRCAIVCRSKHCRYRYSLGRCSDCSRNQGLTGHKR